MHQKLSSFHLTHPILIISYLHVIALIICNFLYPLGFIDSFYVLFFYLRTSLFLFHSFFLFYFPAFSLDSFLSFLSFIFFISYFHSYFLYSCILLSIIFSFFFFLFFLFFLFSYFLILYLDGNAFLIITRGFPFLFLF